MESSQEVRGSAEIMEIRCSTLVVASLDETMRGMRVPPPKPFVILVNGLPGTGKTSLGRELAEHFGVPFLSKDAFKERIFDALGWSDKQWSLKVSAASHRLIDYVVEEELRVGHSLVLESNFKADIDSGRLGGWQQRYDCVLVQVLCWADGEVLFQRYLARQATDRHPGHVEDASIEEQRAGLLIGRCEPLRIDGATIEVDTTRFETLEVSSVCEAVDAALRTRR